MPRAAPKKLKKNGLPRLKPGPQVKDRGPAILMAAEQGLRKDLGELANDPLSWVYYAFPWNEPGTALEGWDGPDEWQKDVLRDMTRQLKGGSRDRGEVIAEAVSSGTGVGKSGLVAWIILWSMSTFKNCRGVVTANNERQLRTKTWPELSKWHGMFIAKHWFELTATCLYAKQAEKEWRFDALTWSVTNTEGFQGLHNHGKRSVVIFDESSGVIDKIWDVVDATLNDPNTDLIWCVFANPTKATGRFRRCFGDLKHRWKTWTIDARKCRLGNKTRIAQWAQDYGEDSDFFRVRVKGEFPRAADMQFFSQELVADARKRRYDPQMLQYYPAVMGLDVAGTGKNKTVLTLRRGPRLMWQKRELYTPDQMQLAGKVLDLIRLEQNVACLCVDANGIGKGVADRLAELHKAGQIHCRVVHVFGSNAATDTVQYKNLRAQLHGRCREWLKAGQIPDEPDLEAELTAIEYGFTPTTQIIIESKESMLDRQMQSPDNVDSLCLTFAEDLYMEAGRSAPRVQAIPQQPRRKVVL